MTTKPSQTTFGQDLPRFAEICRDLPKFAEICRNLPWYAKICRDLPGFAEICGDLPRSAKICQDLPRSAEICQGQAQGGPYWGECSQTWAVFAGKVQLNCVCSMSPTPSHIWKIDAKLRAVHAPIPTPVHLREKMTEVLKLKLKLYNNIIQKERGRTFCWWLRENQLHGAGFERFFLYLYVVQSVRLH